MMEKHGKLENLPTQVIKEMIEKKELSIGQLDTRSLDALFEYESEIVCAGKSDDKLLCQIAKLLDSRYYTDNIEQKYRDLIRNTLVLRTNCKTPSS